MIKKIAYYLLIGFLFLLSFRLFSSLYYPALNSDNAISILMIHYFHLPGDLYFWGQDRMGSLIPLIAQIFFKVCHFSALTSEAITHYLILLAGFMAFSSFFKTRIYKILFAIFWFFPPMLVIDLTQYAFGIQYCLIAISCYLLKRKDEDDFMHNRLKYHLLLALVVLLLIIAIWVNDMAIISVFVLAGVLFFYYLKKQNFRSISFKNPELYYALAGILAGYFFIHYAKSLMFYRANYAVIGNFETIRTTTTIFLQTLVSTFKYDPNEPFTAIYSFLVLSLLVFTILQSKKIKLSPTTKKWVLFFLLDAFILLAVILASRFTLLSGVPRRYFTCTYISFGFAFLLIMENLNLKKIYKQLLQSFILLTVIIGFAGMIHTLKYRYPKTFRPMAAVSGDFTKLGKIGIIANYWNSYIISCVDPDMIKATQNDLSPVRNEMLVDEVFNQDNIYIIKNDWLDSFPDSLSQFGTFLYKDADSMRIGDRDVCKYRKKMIFEKYNIEKQFSNTAQQIYDSSLNKNVLFVSQNCDTCLNRHFIFGPYTNVRCGNFTARFYLKTEFSKNAEIALIDVTADCGQTLLGKKELYPGMFISKSKFEYIDINFSANKRYTNVEFRIFYYGNANLYFDHVLLIGK